MGYLFARHLLLRLPRGDRDDYTTNPEHIVSNELFRAALLLASPGFYAVLERHAFLADKLSEKELTTLRKYYNRFCFRSTPFGLFSSVTLAEWRESGDRSVAEASYEAIVSMDQGYQAALMIHLTTGMALREIIFEANPSIYRVLQEFRFLRTDLEGNLRTRDYRLQAITFSRLLHELLQFCRNGRSGIELIQFTVTEAGCSRAEAESYIEFLRDAQIILNRVRAHITGPQYNFKSPAFSGMSRKHTYTTGLPQGPACVWGEAELQRARAILKKDLPPEMRGLIQEDLSVILHRKSGGEYVHQSWQKHLKEGIAALTALVPTEPNAGMRNFIKQFNGHFEGQSIALLAVLDPEAGIGYQAADQEPDNPLLETLQVPVRNEDRHSLDWTPAHRLLLKKWHESDRGNATVIRLSPGDIASITPEDHDLMITGMSVLFRLSGPQLLIENAGGANATALMGRFTVADAEIAGAVREIAAEQEQRNPDVIFAEILHLSDPHTDNINRREHVWRYELPVTAPSGMPPFQQLELSDLYVTVYEHQVFLFSKKNHKLVIPRLSTAYNHSLNKLPMFRFLADLSFEYGRSNLNFDLRHFYPGLEFYPRVEAGLTVLSSATWVLNEAQLKPLCNESPEENLANFEELRSRVALPPEISIAEGDQLLYFDLRERRQVLFFLQCIRQKNEVIIKEIIPGTETKQYNACLVPDSPLRLPSVDRFGDLSNSKRRNKRKHMPGSEWLYLKIYTPKAGASRLLLLIRPILRKKFSQGGISRWFFIRYEDHAPHIRLRMLVNPADIHEILLAFKFKLQERVHQHIIREYQVDVYSRELERYTYGGIEKTEEHFYASSEIILHAIRRATDKLALFRFALNSTALIIAGFIADSVEQASFCHQCYERFLPEFKKMKVHVELDKRFRELRMEIYRAMEEVQEPKSRETEKRLLHFRKSVKNIAATGDIRDPQRISYLSSIIHMHLNRVFTDESRKQEMIIYYFLYKYLSGQHQQRLRRGKNDGQS